MRRLLALGHVTRDELADGERLGGAVSYAAMAARRLGWEAGVATCAAPDFDPGGELAGISVFRAPSSETTRFRNLYEAGERTQMLLARAGRVDASLVPEAWREPDVLLLAPVAGELAAETARGFGAALVGACAQGWLRDVDSETRRVRPGGWLEPGADLAGVQVVFVSDADLGRDSSRARALLAHVPIVLLTLGRRGAELITRDGGRSIAVRPSQETDATGAGDVFAAAFLIGYAETGDAAEAAAFACCAAACAVEAPGTSGLADRAEVERRLALRRRWLQNGDNR